jgi:hypothetical protein
MKNITFLLSVAAIAAMVVGCQTADSGGAKLPQDAGKYNFEDTSKFVLFDAGAQRSVTCPGIQESRTSDGRMKVNANLRNRENRRIEVQANCVFKDAQGFAIDETPFRTVILDENATESVSFESFRKDVSKYTIRVREAR